MSDKEQGPPSGEGPIRFDNLVRSERYFTATLLPAILFHPGGLDAFLGLVEKCSVAHPEGRTERDRLGVRKPRRHDPSSWSWGTVEIIAEHHIARDLEFDGKLAPLVPQPQSTATPERQTRDAPDLVIVLDDELVMCEAKFFDRYTLATLNRQLLSQRRQIRHLFAARPDLRAFQHIAILPRKPTGSLDCDAVITWTEIADLAATVLGDTHYVTSRLRAAVAYFNRLYPPNPSLGANYDGVLPLEVMLSMCRARGDQIQVGHGGGTVNLRRRPIEYLGAKSWKWRDPATNTGKILRTNWIAGSQFLALVEEMRAQAADSPPRIYLIPGR